jgi:hypothetical protein
MYSLKEVIIDHVELGANVISPKVANEANSAGVQGRSAHVLSLSRPRLPLWYFPSILEPRLQDIDGAAPEMGVNNGQKRGFGTTPHFMRSELSGLIGQFIVKVDGVGEGQGPQVALIMFRPPEGSINHHGATGTDSVLDGILCHLVMVVATNPAMFDALSLGREFGGKFLGGVNAIVGAVVANVDPSGSGFALKPELGLYGFGTDEPHLVYHGEFGTGGVTKDGAAPEFLSREVIAASRELTTKEW